MSLLTRLSALLLIVLLVAALSYGTMWVQHELVTVGTVVPYGGSVAPSGYLLCDGSEYSKARYPRLFAVIGSQFGNPSSDERFCVPDMRGVVPLGTTFGSGPHGRNIGDDGGSSSMHLEVRHLPPHVHAISDTEHTHVLVTSQDDFNGTAGVSSATNGQLPSFVHDNGGEFRWDGLTSYTMPISSVTTHTNYYGQNPVEANFTGIENTAVDASATTDLTFSETAVAATFSIQNPYVALNYIIKI
jgi:microcystin-dependent protein